MAQVANLGGGFVVDARNSSCSHVLIACAMARAVNPCGRVLAAVPRVALRMETQAEARVCRAD